MSQYLRYMYVPSPRSIYEGIYKLEPGTILKIDDIPLQSPPRKPLRPGDIYEVSYSSILEFKRTS